MRAWRWVGWLGVAALAGWFGVVSGAQTQQHAQLAPQLGMGEVRSVAFSPDGKCAVTGSDDQQVRLWDVSNGKQVRAFYGSASVVSSVAFSPDGRFVAGGNEANSVLLWDAVSGELLRTITAPAARQAANGRITSVVFSADGQLILAGSSDGNARVWVPSTGHLVRTLSGYPGWVTAVAFSKDGRLIVTGGGTARLWDARSGNLLRSFDGEAGGNVSIAFSPDGNSVVTGSVTGIAQLWDTKTGQMIRFLNDASEYYTGHTDFLTSIGFSPDGRLVLAGSRNKTARIWNVATGETKHVFRGHSGPVNVAAFSPDGKYVLTGSDDKTARMWDAATGEELSVFAGHTYGVSSVAFSSDGRFLLAGSSKLNPLSGSGSARLWQIAAGGSARSLAADKVAISPDGRFALSSLQNTLRLLDGETGQVIRAFQGELSTDYITSVAFSPDGRYVLAGNMSDVARIWDRETGMLLRSFEVGEDPLNNSEVESAAFSGDGRYVLTGDLEARLWSVTSGKELRSFDAGAAGVTSVAFSPDQGSRTMLTGNGLGFVSLWDRETGREIGSFSASKETIASAAFSPDGELIVTGGRDNIARIWETSTGRLVHSLEGHVLPIHSVAFSSDGRFVLSGSADTTTRLWDAATGKQLLTLLSFENGGWVVVDQEGRFDTVDLDGGAPLAWVVSSDPMRALPLEIFMHDYYTPGLLTRVMKGEKLPEVRSIAEIKNRVQPEVKVASVKPAQMLGRVDVTVHAASVTDERGVKSGLQDLRLFRDGQMVADGYREGTLKNGDYVFRDVMLKSDAKKVTFTAYAFNSEKIKSATASLDYEVKTPGAVVKRRAFLLQVGVDHTMAQGCELKYSVNDAEAMSAALRERLEKQGFEVEAVKLESGAANDARATTNTGVSPLRPSPPLRASTPAGDPGSASGRDDTLIGSASKDMIRAKLVEIAAKATPDDVFFMSFSGHGYSAAGGAFYVLPADVQGSCADAAGLKNLISADELADWLRPIDAGEMTLILDACYSAESVQAGDFKPGPMGSRGLGQVAYDKRMRVLAASQSDAVAHEYDYLHEGLLSYVLVQDGLGKDKADWKPKDGKITVGEWLSYAAAKVPEFKPAAPTGENKGTKVENTADGWKTAGVAKTARQVPALFDFSRQDTLVLAK